MTLGDLENLCAFWLDDLNFGYFTRDQLKFWLNNAQTEAQKKLLQAHQNFYVTPVQTTLVVSQSNYILPDDFLHLHRLELVMSGTPPNEDVSPIAPITMNQFDLVPSHTGTPQFYYLKRNRLVLTPAPDTALTMRLYYSYLVTDMVNLTDSPDIPDAYHEYLAVLATLDGLAKDGRDSQPMLIKRKFYEEMMDKETQERNEDAPRSIITTGGDLTQSFGYF